MSWNVGDTLYDWWTGIADIGRGIGNVGADIFRGVSPWLDAFGVWGGTQGSTHPGSTPIISPATAPAPGQRVPSAAGQPASVASAGFIAPMLGAGSRIPTIGRSLLPAAAAGGAVIAGGIRSVLLKARLATGSAMSSRKLVSLIKQFGWAVVASWTGLTVAELMGVWEHQTRRRRRRWTRRDMSRARGYLRYLEGQAREFKRLTGRPLHRTHHHRASSSRRGSTITNIK